MGSAAATRSAGSPRCRQDYRAPDSGTVCAGGNVRLEGRHAVRRTRHRLPRQEESERHGKGDRVHPARLTALLLGESVAFSAKDPVRRARHSGERGVVARGGRPEVPGHAHHGGRDRGRSRSDHGVRQVPARRGAGGLTAGTVTPPSPLTTRPPDLLQDPCADSGTQDDVHVNAAMVSLTEGASRPTVSGGGPVPASAARTFDNAAGREDPSRPSPPRTPASAAAVWRAPLPNGWHWGRSRRCPAACGPATPGRGGAGHGRCQVQPFTLRPGTRPP